MLVNESVDHALRHVNWHLFLQQKVALVETISMLEKDSNDKKKAADKLTGILHMLDSIQDAAEGEGYFVYNEVRLITEEDE